MSPPSELLSPFAVINICKLNHDHLYPAYRKTAVITQLFNQHIDLSSGFGTRLACLINLVVIFNIHFSFLTYKNDFQLDKHNKKHPSDITSLNIEEQKNHPPSSTGEWNLIFTVPFGPHVSNANR